MRRSSRGSREAALTDNLTGLGNHRSFHEDLRREIARRTRSGSCFSLVMLDLNGLKQLNDRLGHQAGDERIRAVADCLRATMRATDAAYRTGGDEFIVLLPDERAWGALEFARRLQDEIAAPSRRAGRHLRDRRVGRIRDCRHAASSRRPRPVRRQAVGPSDRPLRGRARAEAGHPPRPSGDAPRAQAPRHGARAGRRREGRWDSQPLRDRLRAVRPDRAVARARRRPDRAAPACRPAARRRQDRRLRRDPSEARTAGRRRGR